MAAAAIDVIERHTDAMLSELRGLVDRRSQASEEPRRPVKRTEAKGWTEIRRLAGQSYRWPEQNGGLEEFDPFVVYESGGLLLGIARVANWPGRREQVWVLTMKNDQEPGRPLTPFIASDTTDEMVSLIRGNGPTGRAMFGPGDQLPPHYAEMKVELYSDHRNGGYRKLCVVADKDDAETMLRHCAAQVELRGL